MGMTANKYNTAEIIYRDDCIVVLTPMDCGDHSIVFDHDAKTVQVVFDDEDSAVSK